MSPRDFRIQFAWAFSEKAATHPPHNPRGSLPSDRPRVHLQDAKGVAARGGSLKVKHAARLLAGDRSDQLPHGRGFRLGDVLRNELGIPVGNIEGWVEEDRIVRWPAELADSVFQRQQCGG